MALRPQSDVLHFGSHIPPEWGRLGAAGRDAAEVSQSMTLVDVFNGLWTCRDPYYRQLSVMAEAGPRPALPTCDINRLLSYLQ